MTNELTTTVTEIDTLTPDWGADAPRGGKSVLNRILKEKATVPLFFAQTLISSLRDLGYDSTTSALCENVDNALQWGANEIRVYFAQSGRRGSYKMDILVLDNGNGMAPNVLKVACSFGGSMVYGNRAGIGRYGMGMKTAALSMSPIMDLYSWQEPDAIYNMTLDVNEIGRERSNLIELPDPTLLMSLPTNISEILTKALVFPEHSEQSLIASNDLDLKYALGKSGTIVFMPECDRLSSVTAKTLCEQTLLIFSRVYRRFIANGVNIYVNNRRVEPFDPTFSMPGARNTNLPEIGIKQSRLIITRVINVPRSEASKDSQKEESFPVTIKLYALPIEDWASLPFSIRKRNLHLYDDHVISVMRNDREVFIGSIPEITRKHADFNWIRIQIDFGGELDEAFGVAANKQGIGPKKYLLKAIAEQLQDEIATLREKIKDHQSERASARRGSKQSAAEIKAADAEVWQSTPLPEATEEEKLQIEANLRGLAVWLKRDQETDDEAFERIKKSVYIIHFKHDKFWPFYTVDKQFGKIILTINSAHPFFEKLYKPLSEAKDVVTAAPESINGDNDSFGLDSTQIAGAADALEALELMLLSLARTQSTMITADPDRKRIFEDPGKDWSDVYKRQLTTS